MAISYIGLSTAFASKTAGTSVQFAVDVTINTGDWIVFTMATDNVQTTDGATTLHSGLTVAGATFTKLLEYTNGQGAAAAGATGSIWLGQATAPIVATSTVWTATFTSSIAAKAWTALRFSSSGPLSLAGQAFGYADGVNNAITSISGLPSAEYLFLRGIAQETASGAITPTSTWTGITGGASSGGNAATNIGNPVEFKILTGTGATGSGGTQNVDSVSLMVAIKETLSTPLEVSRTTSWNVEQSSVSNIKESFSAPLVNPPWTSIPAEFSIVGGRGVLPANTAYPTLSLGNFPGCPYTFVGAALSIEVTTVPTGATAGGYVEVRAPDTGATKNVIDIFFESGVMYFRQIVGGASTSSSATYDPVAHRYWRIRHDAGANLVHWETSADGVAWTSRRSAAPGFAIGSVRPAIVAGNYGADAAPGTFEFDNLNIQSVEKAASTTWNLSAQVTPARTTTWDTKGELVDAISTTWAVRGEVVDPYSTSWAVRSEAVAARTTTWNVFGEATAARTTSWDLPGSLTTGRTSTWDVKAAVEDPLNTSWAVRSEVVDPYSSTWDLRSEVIDPYSTRWNVTGTAEAARTSTWGVGGSLESTRTTRWDLRSEASQPRTTTWDLRTTAETPRTTTSDVRAEVVAARTSTWNVIGTAERARTTSWAVAAEVSSARTTRWDLRGEVGGGATPETPSSIGGYRIADDIVAWVNGETFTIEFEFRTTGTGQPLLGQINGGGGGNVPAAYIDTSGFLRTSAFWHGSTVQNVSTVALNDGVRHRVGITYNGTVESLIVDGVLVDTQTVAQSSYGGPYRYFVGAGTGNTWTGWPGDASITLSDGYALTGAKMTSGWVSPPTVRQGEAKTADQVGLPGLSRPSIVTRWDLRSDVETARTTTWHDTTDVVGPSITTTWDVAEGTEPRTAVEVSRTTTWDVVGSLVAARSTTWSVTGTAESTRSTNWAVRAEAAQVRTTTWDLRSAAERARTTTWAVAGEAIATRSSTWNLSATVDRARTTTWDTRASVESTRTTTWPVRGELTPARTTTWAVLSEAIRTRTTTWNTVGSATAARATTWDTKASTEALRSTTWGLSGSVTAARTTTWGVPGSLDVPRTTSWAVRGEAITARSTTWNLALGFTIRTPAQPTSGIVVERFTSGDVDFFDTSGLELQNATAGMVRERVTLGDTTPERITRGTADEFLTRGTVAHGRDLLEIETFDVMPADLQTTAFFITNNHVRVVSGELQSKGGAHWYLTGSRWQLGSVFDMSWFIRFPSGEGRDIANLAFWITQPGLNANGWCYRIQSGGGDSGFFKVVNGAHQQTGITGDDYSQPAPPLNEVLGVRLRGVADKVRATTVRANGAIFEDYTVTLGAGNRAGTIGEKHDGASGVSGHFYTHLSKLDPDFNLGLPSTMGSPRERKTTIKELW